MMCSWWANRKRTQGVKPDPVFQSIARLDDTTNGFIEGVMELPVDGRWIARFGFFVPSKGRADADEIFPVEKFDTPDETDEYKLNINGQERVLYASRSLQGHKESIEIVFEGQELRYRFDYKSAKVPRFVHAFFSNAEVTLIRDKNLPPSSSSSSGRIVAEATDAVDGKTLSVGRWVSNGYVEGAWKVGEDPKLSVFAGSTLVKEISFSSGKLDEELPVGDYSCIAMIKDFYAVFVRNCKVARGNNYLGQLSFSPVLNPGNTRVVLNWGATPSDLDTYLTVPDANPARQSCLVSYKNKICNEGKIDQVNLDLDATSHSQRGGNPETTTFGVLTSGKYVMRVQQYRGSDSSGLLNSGAVVDFYSEMYQTRFAVGRDGYVEGINWFVFYIDGDSRKIFPCDRENCPTSLCASGGYRLQTRQGYLC